MKRAELKELGIADEIIDKIMDANGKDIEKTKGNASELEKQVETLSGQIKDRDKQLTDLQKAAGDNEALAEKIKELKEANEAAKASYTKEINQIKIDSAVERAIATSKAKNAKAVKALLDLTDAKLDSDGNIKGLSDQLDKLKETDSYLFDTAPKITGAEPQSGSDLHKGISKDEFSHMGYAQRAKLFETDRETYDALKESK